MPYINIYAPSTGRIHSDSVPTKGEQAVQSVQTNVGLKRRVLQSGKQKLCTLTWSKIKSGLGQGQNTSTCAQYMGNISNHSPLTVLVAAVRNVAEILWKSQSGSHLKKSRRVILI